MDRFDGVLSWLENFTAGVSLVCATALTIIGVILRYIFGTSIYWGEEVTIYLLALSTFTGAAITLRHNEHVGVDAITFLLKSRGKWVVHMLSTLVTVAYCAIFGAYAWLMITEPALHNTVSPALGAPLWIVQLSLPVGLTLMLIRCLEILYRTFRLRSPFSHPEEHRFEDGGPI